MMVAFLTQAQVNQVQSYSASSSPINLAVQDVTKEANDSQVPLINQQSPPDIPSPIVQDDNENTSNKEEVTTVEMTNLPPTTPSTKRPSGRAMRFSERWESVWRMVPAFQSRRPNPR
jgi:hypothetical protein